ncbi:hypothetical protein [Terracoccus sp. 273MFTsu3.1]|uniref:hypothetical protein n=1 Tax=Terracoccus sp. 273MFTsu3.1 TaxID=1172188 RepID=UPI00037F3276|nr:hypothetical protein [Terracoccus sp. 273MFTsu3.1]
MTTALQVAEKAIQLADQNPHFVYKSPLTGPVKDCLYVHEGKGSCIFGQALLALGVADAEYLDKNKDLRIGTLLRRMADARLIAPIPTIDDQVLLTRMGSAQRAQDDGMEWGDAVATLREHVGKQAA